MSNQSFDGLYAKLSDTHNDCVNDLKNAIDDEEYDYIDFAEIVSADDGDLDTFLEDNSLDNVNGLKAAIIKYVKGTSNDSNIVTRNINSNINNIGGIPIIINKSIDAYKSINRLPSDNDLQSFANEVKCPGLYYDADKAYNDFIKLSKINGPREESLVGMYADNFTRYYINEYLKSKKNVEVPQWIQDKLSPYFVNNVNAKTKIGSGLVAFFKRANIHMRLPPNQYIDDDINVFAKIVIQIFDVISNILNALQTGKAYELPLQLDFALFPRNIVDATYDDDPDSDADTDPDSDSETKIDDDDDDDINIDDALTDFKDDDIFRGTIDFDEKGSDTYNQLMRPLQQLLKDSNKTRNKRFAYIIDRKFKKNKPKKSSYKLYTFKPKKHDIIHKDYIPEVLIFNSKYIFKQPGPHAKIGLNDAKVYGLSFHLINKDIIKCYQYWGTGISRFSIDDIQKLWPELFVKINKKKQTIKPEILQEINDIKNKNILTNNDIYSELTK